STNAAEGDPLGEAGAAKTLIVDQFEQAIVRLSRDPAGPGAFEQAVIAWLAADADRRAVLVIRDEYRTAFDTVLPELSERARSFALLPLRVADAAHALTTILDSARIEHDPGFVGRLVDELADGVPPRVRPAMLQLVAHEAWASRRRFDKNLWEQTPTSRRAFFERHVRSTVLGQLAASISRYDAARALRGLCVAELKAAPRTAEEVATAEQQSPAIAPQSPTAEAENALRDALSSTSGRALAGHSSPIDRIAVSRDGRQLATSDTSGTIRIWKVEDLTAPAHVLVQPYSSSSMSRSLA